MRLSMIAALAATLFIASPTLAQTRASGLDGAVQGTLTSKAEGQVKVESTGAGQVVRFDDDFKVDYRNGAEVRHIDRSTGRVTNLGPLKQKQGSQTYSVPSKVKVTNSDFITVYSPNYDEDVATVELLDE
jgi:hypothetical protein